MASSVRIPLVAERAEPHVRPSNLVVYLVFLAAIPLFFYLLPFMLVRTPQFVHYAGSQFSPALDYSFTTAGQNADIVVYGDSSAFYGVSPIQMSKELDLKVLNLPNTGGSLPIIDDLPLRYYLSVNKAPKLIVLYFAPWDLEYSHEESRFAFEGEQVLLRHGTLNELTSFALKHPNDALEFPFKIYSTGPKAAIVAAMHHEDRFATVARNFGHVETASVSAGGRKALTNIQAPCKVPESFLNRGLTSVQSLRARYDVGKSKVLVFLAPVPNCDNISSVLTSDYASVAAARPGTLPPNSYRDDGFFIHLDPSAVPQATSALTAAVKQALVEPSH